MQGPWWRLGLEELGRGLRDGSLDAVPLADRCLDRIARLDPALNTMVFVDAAGARRAAEASAARFRARRPLSPLDGIPITIKDNLLVAGLPATWGSRGFAHHVPAEDEAPVRRLRAAGAVIVGKTNVPELTLEGYTSNLLFGTTRNPFDHALTPGGSSGGAAAGVAAGFVPVAIGTDGGGSLRRPACHTGLVGFKSSIGRYPRAGGFPELLSDCEVVGALTRSVADTRIVDAVLAGLDPPSHPPETVASPAPLRILYVPRFGAAPLDRAVEAQTDAVAQWLAAQGHAVETGPVPFETAETDDIWRVIGRSGVAMLVRLHGPAFLDQTGPFVQALAREGAALSAAEYVDVLGRIGAFRHRMGALFKRFDLVFTPSAAALPWPAGDAYPPEIDGQPVGPRGHAVYTAWVNICGHPAIGLPLGQSDTGLPIGGQFVAPRGADAALLGFAAWFESTRAAPPAWPAVAETAEPGASTEGFAFPPRSP